MLLNELFDELREYSCQAHKGDFEPAITEIDDIEEFADRLFNRAGVDIDFTNHFKSRLRRYQQSEENSPYGTITICELKILFEKAFQKYANQLLRFFKKNRAAPEAVFRDLSNDLNIPFKVRWSRKDEMLELTGKTIMRKKDFRTTNRVFKL